MFIKVCGIKNFEEINWAIELGYSAIGIVVYKKSKRFVDYEKAEKLIRYAKGKILTVAVSLYSEDVEKFAYLADFIQAYNYSNYKNFIFATNEVPDKKIFFKYLLFDSSRGSGTFSKFPEWLKTYSDKLIVAGGLNYKNVTQVIKDLNPFGVDVSSGVEKENKKDYDLMKKFIFNIKSERK